MGQNELGNEQRIAQIGQRVIETLRRVNDTQLRKVRFPIFANEHLVARACLPQAGFRACLVFIFAALAEVKCRQAEEPVSQLVIRQASG